MTAEIKVSEKTYLEIANALDAIGKKFAPGTPLTIEKDVSIVNPLEWRTIQVRKDAVEQAVKVYAEANQDGEQSSENFVIFADEVYQFILRGTVPEVKGMQADKPKPIPKKRTEPLQQTPEQKWGK